MIPMTVIMSSHMYTIEEVIDFCKNNEIVIVNRADGKYEDFMRSVKMTYEEAIQEIRSLKKDFLYNGPFLDRDIPNNYLYEFHMHVKGKWCYIKLTIDDNKIVVVRVISFHESRGVAYA